MSPSISTDPAAAAVSGRSDLGFLGDGVEDHGTVGGGRLPEEQPCERERTRREGVTGWFGSDGAMLHLRKAAICD